MKLLSQSSLSFIPMRSTSLRLSSRILAPLLTIALAILCSGLGRAADPTPDYVWIEGENTSSVEPATVKPNISQGAPNILSGGKWLQISIDPGSVDAAVPATGIILSYAANVTNAASYDIWIHIGSELVRSPFDWRIDQGPWQTVQPTDYTTDVQEIGVWAPVAWMDLGKQNLTAGSHTIQMRLTKAKGKDGTYPQTTFALDCFCLSSKPFHPDGTIKPGDTSWMTDNDKAAATQTYNVPVPTAAAQAPLPLDGLWQYANDDELTVDDRLGPVKSLPDLSTLTWHGMKAGDRNDLLPDQTYIHRYYLRTRVNVPAELAGHSFVLHAPGVNTVATVFVNGQQVGWTKIDFADWDLDLTSAIKPGQVNEICVAFKDTF
jgi:hypothetical protein